MNDNAIRSNFLFYHLQDTSVHSPDSSYEQHRVKARHNNDKQLATVDYDATFHYFWVNCLKASPENKQQYRSSDKRFNREVEALKSKRKPQRRLKQGRNA
jgi:hypothetical protein